MDIVWQETENECGACAVAILAGALHGARVDRADAVLRANLSDGGMTVADLEALALEFGVRLESYECEARELSSLAPGRLHVALLRREAGLHYACFSLDAGRGRVSVYDSARGEYKATLAEFAREFAGVVCTAERVDAPPRAQGPRKLAMRDFMAPGAFCGQLALHALFVGLGIAGAQLLKVLIDGTVAYASAANVAAIVAPFAAMKLIELLSGACASLLQARHVRDAGMRWWGAVLRALPRHDFAFWRKRPHGTLFELDGHLSAVAGFYCRTAAEAGVAAATVVACAGALAAANPLFVAVGAGQIAFSGLVLAMKWSLQRRALPQMLGRAQRHNALLAGLGEGASRESWRGAYEKAAAAVRGNAAAAARDAERLHWSAQALDRAGDVAAFACGALAAGLGVSLAVSAGGADVSDMLYALSLLALLGSNADRLIAAGFAYPAFKAARKRLEGFAFAGGEGDDGEGRPKPVGVRPREVAFKGVSLVDGGKTVFSGWSGTLSGLTALRGKNGAGKSSLLKAATGRFPAVKGEIAIDGTPLCDLGADWLFENVIYIDGASGLGSAPDDLRACAENPGLIAFLRAAGLFSTAPGARSAGQRQLARLAALQGEKNKVILLDEPLSSVSRALRPAAFDMLVAPLAQSNLVAFAEHDRRLHAKAQRVVGVGDEGED